MIDRIGLTGAATAVLGLAIGAPVQAQNTSSNSGLDDIIVTAQKRETRLETTPMTINVVSGADVEAMGAVELKSLSATVPGFTMHESPGNLSGVSLRGVGTSGGSQVFEQSVGLFVDGIYQPRARQYRDALFDVERVEVVKGSQGVLFGKNTSVGAVSIISRGPGDRTGGYAQGQVEANYGSYALEGALDVVASDRFKFRVAGLYDDQAGFVRNVTKDRREPSGNRYIVRTVADWNPSDTVSVRAKAQFSRLDMHGSAFEFVADQNVPVLESYGVLDGGLHNYVKYESSDNVGDSYDFQKTQNYALEINVDLGNDYTLTSTSGYSRFDYSNAFDSDSTPQNFLFSEFNENFRQASEEIRLTSPSGKAIEFIVGAFYLHSTTDYDYLTWYDDFFGIYFGNFGQRFKQKQDTFAAFGQATWHIADDLQLNVGGRVTSDKKKASWQRYLIDDLGHPTGIVALLANTPLLEQKVTDNTVDLSATLSYNPTETSTFYASIGQGNKGSGFVNQGALSLPAPDPFMVPVERVRTVEAGVKGRFLDGRLFMSLAAYHLDIRNYQDSFYNSVARAFQVRSLDAKSSGVEVEGQYLIAPELTLYGNLSWNPQAKLANGERMQRAPRFTSTLGVRGNTRLSSDFTLSGFGQWVHSASMLHQPASAPGDNWSHPYDLFSARLQLTYEPAQLSVYVIGANLSKDVYRTFSYGSPLAIGQVGALNDPRTFTFGIRKEF